VRGISHGRIYKGYAQVCRVCEYMWYVMWPNMEGILAP